MNSINNNYENDIIDALQAADWALFCMDNARNSLKDARAWGTIDVFFDDDIFSDLMKHGRMRESENYMEQANQALMNLNRKMNFVNKQFNLNLRLNDLISFADYFVDDLLSGWIVQGRIHDAYHVVNDAMNYVGWLKNNLLFRLSQIRAQQGLYMQGSSEDSFGNNN